MIIKIDYQNIKPGRYALIDDGTLTICISGGFCEHNLGQQAVLSISVIALRIA